MATDGLLDAVIFVWGGTLSIHADLDVERLWAPTAVLLVEHEARGAAPDPARVEEVRATLAMIEAETWARVREDQASTTLERIIGEACRRLEIVDDPHAVAGAAAGHLDAWTPHLVHRHDAAATLGVLRGAGLRLGLLSNTHWPRRFHQELLARDGLDLLLDATCYTSELARTKPHPLAFRAVLHLLEIVDPRRAVFVGDRPYDDCYGARQMGMRTIRMRNASVEEDDVPSSLVYADHRADAVVDDLAEVPEWVERWSRA